MIVSYKGGFAFIKTIKTASTSVEIFLSQYCGAEDIITYLPPPDEAIRRELGHPGPQNCFYPWHARWVRKWMGLSRRERLHRHHHNMSAATLKQQLAEDVWDRILKFTIVRNPYDRAISKFYNDFRGGHCRGQGHTPAHVSEYIVGLPDRELTNWHLYTNDNGEIIVDEVIRYEALTGQLTHVLRRLGIRDKPALPRAKGDWRLDRRHYSQVLSQAARARIEAAAGKELTTFGYRWEDVPVEAPIESRSQILPAA